MRFCVNPIVFFALSAVFSQNIPSNIGPDNTNKENLTEKSIFYSTNSLRKKRLYEKVTPVVIETDSIGLHPITLLVNKKQKPVLYTADIATPVCADGACKLMNIRLYWTLLGSYAGFDSYTDLPLTKHDHDSFLFSDYEKLHLLLLDNNSILKRRKINDLVRKQKIKMPNDVDALSGATIDEVKESVVTGALYSCYVAWHLVHGEIKEELKAYTTSIVSNEMLIDMLFSSSSEYQMFALKKMNKHQYKEYYQRIAEIFKTGTPLLRTFIIKNNPEDFWTTPKLQRPFWKQFSNVDVNSRTLMLERLHRTSRNILELLSFELGVMTKNQIKVYLTNLGGPQQIEPIVKKNLESFSNNNQYEYGYVVKQFLEGWE